MANPPYAQQRRSSRVQLRCRVKISGVDPQGKAFSEEAETLTISKFGACLLTARSYELGQIITVQALGHGHTGQFQVVWIGQPGTREEGQTGIEWSEVRHFWGIEFPPEDWGGR